PLAQPKGCGGLSLSLDFVGRRGALPPGPAARPLPKSTGTSRPHVTIAPEAQAMDCLTRKTSQRNQFVDVTEPVRQSLRRAGIRDGLGVVYCPHTTAAITINEHADPDVAHDILLWLGRTVPQQQDGVDFLPGAV